MTRRCRRSTVSRRLALRSHAAHSLPLPAHHSRRRGSPRVSPGRLAIPLPPLGAAGLALRVASHVPSPTTRGAAGLALRASPRMLPPPTTTLVATGLARSPVPRRASARRSWGRTRRASGWASDTCAFLTRLSSGRRRHTDTRWTADERMCHLLPPSLPPGLCFTAGAIPRCFGPSWSLYALQVWVCNRRVTAV